MFGSDWFTQAYLARMGFCGFGLVRVGSGCVFFAWKFCVTLAACQYQVTNQPKPTTHSCAWVKFVRSGPLIWPGLFGFVCLGLVYSGLSCSYGFGLGWVAFVFG